MLGGATGQTSGAVYELVSRGVKDSYFFAEPTAGAFTPFSNKYVKTTPFLSETKTTVATSSTDFGKTVEFEIERYGDVLTDVWFQVDFPSWIPAAAAAAPLDNYGYQAAAGFFLFERIEILQGQMIIMETSGDTLYWLSGNRRRGAMTELVRELGGDVAEGHLGAHVRGLRIRIPFPGCQSDVLGGFPLCTVPDKVYKIRVKLRPFAELVTWGAGDEGPWGKTVRDAHGIALYTALREYELDSPNVVLETTQAYLTREAREAMRGQAAGAQGIQIPFVTHYEQQFQLRVDGRKPYLLEPKHPSEGIYIYAMPVNAARKKDISGAAISAIEFTLAGREREFEWGSTVLVDIAAHAKMISLPPMRGIYALNWSLGDSSRPRSQDPMLRRPEGTINFSEADKPTLYVTPNPAVVTRNGPVYIMHVIVESWRLYNIQGDGYGRVAFI
jgi:hypothetical protein